MRSKTETRIEQWSCGRRFSKSNWTRRLKTERLERWT